MIKIKSPLTRKEEVEILVESGANEFFCGVQPSVWRKSFKSLAINQRGQSGNFQSFKELELAIKDAHKLKSKVHVAMNGFFYLEGQYKLANEIIRVILDLGADGIIFADPVLISLSRKLLKDKDVIVGTDATVFNHYSCSFFKGFGATRVVIPRATTIKEIEQIISYDKNIEYEVFIINDLCFFVDGFCAFCKETANDNHLLNLKNKSNKVMFFSSQKLPNKERGGCRSLMNKVRVTKNKIEQKSKYSFWNKKRIYGCGACALFDFNNIGVTHVKILDRNLPMEEKVISTRFIKESLSFLKNNGLSKEEYIERCKELFKRMFKFRCKPYDYCYYPSALIKKKK
ncbi:MAG: U32 family peptidase [Candidatus Gygaella obscura]|nr:U32 family peptidase [Candidatus Gygaella obscura]